MHTKFDKKYMEMALILSTLSHSWRKKVGCLIVSYNGQIPQIVSDGVNGTLPGHSNECEDAEGKTYDYVIHAEENALKKLGDKFKLKGCTAYVTFQPCLKCAMKLVKAEISKVVYTMDYKEDKGINYLKSNNVEVVYIPISLITDKVSPEIDYSGYLRAKLVGFANIEEEVNRMIVKSRSAGKYIYDCSK